MSEPRPFDVQAATRIKRRGGVYVDDFCIDCGLGLVGRFGGRSSRCPGCEARWKAAANTSRRAMTPEEARPLMDGASFLTYRERRVLEMALGLNDDGRRYTQDEIARTFSVTRDRVRQVRDGAVRKLRGQQYPQGAARP